MGSGTWVGGEETEILGQLLLVAQTGHCRKKFWAEKGPWAGVKMLFLVLLVIPAKQSCLLCSYQQSDLLGLLLRYQPVVYKILSGVDFHNL